jgi:hypothetical protein
MAYIDLGGGQPVPIDVLETAADADDPVVQEIRTVRNYFQVILALGEAMEAALELVALTARDDNVREIAQTIKSKHRYALGVYADTMDGDDPDWRYESPISLLRWCENEQGGETLLIPELRKKLQGVLEHEFTEEEFDDYLGHLRRCYRLSESFK